MLSTILSVLFTNVKGDSGEQAAIEAEEGFALGGQEHFCPDVPEAEMIWYWGYYPDAPDLEGYFWTDVDPRGLDNYLADDYEPYDTRQGVSYPTSAFF